jgi:transcriptional regulator with XRE-family HTH domain
MAAGNPWLPDSGWVPDLISDLTERLAFSRKPGLRQQRLLAARGYSHEKVAHLVGISAYTYQKFEKGESKPGTPMNPRMFTLLALARVYEGEVGDLLGT